MNQGSAAIEILVGKVGRAHGLRGEVSIEVRTDEPDRRFAPGARFRTPRGDLTLAGAKWHGQRLLGKFHGTDDRTSAEALLGTELLVDVPADERPADPEEFYDHQLVGLQVEDEAGAPVGPVTELLHVPGQDILVVRRAGGDVLIPFVAEFVPTVDLAGRRIVVAPQPGLFNDDPAQAEPDIDEGI